MSLERAPRARSASYSSRRRGLLRALAYAVLLAAFGSALLARKGMAELSEHTLGLGHGLGAWSALIGPSTEVTLNGQSLFLGSTTLPLSLEQVLERFTALCMQDGGDPLAGLEGPATGAAEASWLEPLLVLRRVLEDEAAGVCLAGAARGGAEALAARLRRFARTRDLGAIGALRYLHARETAGGAHVVVAWSRGPLSLDALVPERGDAPGEDFPEGVRPGGAVRVLSAAARGSEHQMNLYRSAHAGRQAMADYARTLQEIGFEPLPGGASSPLPSELGRAYAREDEVLLVRAQDDGAGSLLSVLQLGGEVRP